MARRASNFRFGSLMLALVIAIALWSMAHGQSSIERGFDVPVVFHGIPDTLVITDQSADVVNIRVLASLAAHRNLTASTMEYAISVDGAQRGTAAYEIDTSQIALPRGSRVVSRSPATLEVEFERRGRRSVKVRPDVVGDPAPGFQIAEIAVEPPRIWLAGARSDVLRLSEVVTETIDIAGLAEVSEREVRLSLGGGHIWMEEPQPVQVRIQIEAVPAEEEVAAELQS